MAEHLFRTHAIDLCEQLVHHLGDGGLSNLLRSWAWRLESSANKTENSA